MIPFACFSSHLLRIVTIINRFDSLQEHHNRLKFNICWTPSLVHDTFNPEEKILLSTEQECPAVFLGWFSCPPQALFIMSNVFRNWYWGWFLYQMLSLLCFLWQNFMAMMFFVFQSSVVGLAPGQIRFIKVLWGVCSLTALQCPILRVSFVF